MLGQYYHSVVDEAAARQVLEHVGLGHRVTHLPSQLSGGEQQRVCIARALVNELPLIFADEPTGNLDERERTPGARPAARTACTGRTIVMVTHNPNLGVVSADRIIRLHHGRVVDDEAVPAQGVACAPYWSAPCWSYWQDAKRTSSSSVTRRRRSPPPIRLESPHRSMPGRTTVIPDLLVGRLRRCCVAEMKELEKLTQANDGRIVVVVAVSTSMPRAAGYVGTPPTP